MAGLNVGAGGNRDTQAGAPRWFRAGHSRAAMSSWSVVRLCLPYPLASQPPVHTHPRPFTVFHASAIVGAAGQRSGIREHGVSQPFHVFIIGQLTAWHLHREAIWARIDHQFVHRAVVLHSSDINCQFQPDWSPRGPMRQGAPSREDAKVLQRPFGICVRPWSATMPCC